MITTAGSVGGRIKPIRAFTGRDLHTEEVFACIPCFAVRKRTAAVWTERLRIFRMDIPAPLCSPLEAKPFLPSPSTEVTPKS